MNRCLPPVPLKGEVSPPFRRGVLVITRRLHRRALTWAGKHLALTWVSAEKAMFLPSLGKIAGKHGRSIGWAP